MSKISSILIANRGEIALRVIRACKDLGIKSISVYSDEDNRSIHVKRADESYRLGTAQASESYLRIDKIIEIAKSSGADAIHPGYGFLSENELFSEECKKNGIIFIGPTAKAMELAGDKMKCKEIMKKAEVPTVPGSDGVVEDIELAVDIAKEAGYPVMLKSAFGGGGRGIRLVNNEKELRQEFELASNESKAAFGKSALFIEKYLTNIRHIEYQLLRDSSGNGRHLFERECSIQRRHQKLIEMSPSPVVNKEIREKIGEIAVRASTALDYLNAGTAEFLSDSKGNFYFIEINARLQVEHPVTELVTGKDLVKLQIQVAQGEEIPFKQEDLELKGCAIECRINSEDPFYDFTPSVGYIPNCNIPSGPGVRVDTYLYPGCNVSGYYDSLIAKLITYGGDFNEARVRMKNALSEFTIEGINTTLPIHQTIIEESNFINGNISTDYIEKYNIIEKMKQKRNEDYKDKAYAAISAILLQSEYVKKSNLSPQRVNRIQKSMSGGYY
ncbi:MAG TPA: acetyl-CoA carboxylase biotin carboxylase subunit [Nitrososphaeraceae archaeon]|nr:acetyl-CoA carboxylase biotin carboxylase subunit [Nitrososphaeraceae archaeon]